MDNEVFIHNYKLMDKLGKGAFSTVFKAEHRISKKLVAIKVEKEATTLKHESKILAYLNRELPGLPNIPTLHWYGLYGNNVCLATTFYQMSLTQYLQKSVETGPLFKKLVSILKHLHSVYIVHSDIKPDNFMVDSSENPIMIDFGLSSLFYNAEKDVYRENVRSAHVIGSPKYASYNLHLGNVVSPRDDLISLGYMMITILGIELPWSLDLPSDLLDLPSEETDFPLYHVMHPGNVQRAKYKKFETLKAYLLDYPAAQHLLPYLEQVYGLEYGVVPDYWGG
jgi:serine/threonine protein kinase